MAASTSAWLVMPTENSQYTMSVMTLACCQLRDRPRVVGLFVIQHRKQDTRIKERGHRSLVRRKTSSAVIVGSIPCSRRLASAAWVRSRINASASNSSIASALITSNPAYVASIAHARGMLFRIRGFVGCTAPRGAGSLSLDSSNRVEVLKFECGTFFDSLLRKSLSPPASRQCRA